MKIRSFKELYNELIKVGFVETDKNIVTGEEYEDWNKSRFIEAIDGSKVKEAVSDAVYTYQYDIKISKNIVDSASKYLEKLIKSINVEFYASCINNIEISIKDKKKNTCEQDYSLAA